MALQPLGLVRRGRFDAEINEPRPVLHFVGRIDPNRQPAVVQHRDDLVGVGASELTPAEIDRLRPDVYRRMAEATELTGYHKVHDAYTFTADGRPLFPPDATRGALYFVRNPLDVAVSYSHHLHTDIDTTITCMGRRGHCFAAGTERLHGQLRQRLLTWSEPAVSGPSCSARGRSCARCIIRPIVSITAVPRRKRMFPTHLVIWVR